MRKRIRFEALRLVRARALGSFPGRGLVIKFFSSLTGQLLLYTRPGPTHPPGRVLLWK